MKMKLIVETTGDFSLNDTMERQYMDMNRPTVVVPSFFVDRAVARTQLQVLTQVNDMATDEEFLETLAESKGNKELAIAAFVEMYPLPGKEPAPKEKTEEELKAEAEAKAKEEAEAKAKAEAEAAAKGKGKKG